MPLSKKIVDDAKGKKEIRAAVASKKPPSRIA
jgi:hypothetical protein